MRYDNIHKGKFLSRPNRFIANVEIDGQSRGLPCEKYGQMQRAFD